MLPSVLWARDRYLKPGGEMYPCTATLFLAPITDEGIEERLVDWKQMKDLYGVSMESIKSLSNDALTVRADSQHLNPESVLASACQLCKLDLMTIKVQDAHFVKADFDFKCYGHNTMHGFATWFTVSFPGGVTIDTSPFSLPTHWGQTVMYLRKFVDVEQDSRIKGIYRMQPSTDNPRFWDIDVEFEVNSDEKISQSWHCSD
ncbi:protein arginine N-methyltransferase 6 [Plakobranchus ocellatus]|uniref:Protein arginine N-methyltransferase 6 n=1 Tax=Plakobranchus ocellatus TaxID=259542 RepID=A0AAV4AHV3_9GAST|nr:protein arginine N-methyltransferase 6 [Plakobranchus ocellatus]